MAYIYKRGKTWTARITKRFKVPEKQEDGTFKPKSVLRQSSKGGFKTKAEAKQYAIEEENKQIQGINIQKDPTFADYFKNWYEIYKKPYIRIATAESYKNDVDLVTKYFGYQKIKSITREDYQQFISWLGTNHTNSSIRVINTVIRSCVNSAIDDGLIFRNFTRKFKVKGSRSRGKKVQYLNLDEIKRLKAQLVKARRPPYTAIYMILAALFTGARLGELSALQWSDINFKAGEISITKSWNEIRKQMSKPKTPTSIRTIKVNRWLLNIISELKSNHCDFVFGTKKTKLPPSSIGVNRVLRYYLHKAGINKHGYHFHSLRHSHVAYLRSQGIDWDVISERLGHSSIEVTIHYYAYTLDEHKHKEDKKINSSLEKLSKL